jgi:hypothetical protein
MVSKPSVTDTGGRKCCSVSFRTGLIRQSTTYKQSTEQVNTLQKLDERIEAAKGEEESTTNGVF